MFPNILAAIFIIKLVLAEEEITTGMFQHSKYIDNHSYDKPKRDLLHIHLQTASLAGNSSDLQYFYVDVFVGSHKQKQSLIVDTGSSIAAMPCKGYCKQSYGSKSSCGSHLNSWYDFDQSTAKYLYNCNKDDGCQCVDGNKCKFYQGYMEGSSYSGFMVQDSLKFGQGWHEGHDAFQFSFGCVSKETNLFYDQAADGILGMGMSKSKAVKAQKPIFWAMYDANIVNRVMFNMCLGTNGGYFQIGGYNEDNHLEPVKWMKMLNNYGSYKFNINGVSINNHKINGSQKWNVAFLDSGTTFTYLPNEMWDNLMFHFDDFCNNAHNEPKVDGKNRYCPGNRFSSTSDGEKVMCFKFDPEEWKGRNKEFLMGYPILNFHVQTTTGEDHKIQWFPSEYLYLDRGGKKYCLAADKDSRSNEILFGSTLMRQNDYIFDILNLKIGVARSKCNDDANMIMTVNDYYEYGNVYGIEMNQTLKNDPNYEECNHDHKVTNNYAIKNTKYIAAENVYKEANSPGSKSSLPEKSVWDNGFIKHVVDTISGVFIIFCLMFCVIFCIELSKFAWHKITGKNESSKESQPLTSSRSRRYRMDQRQNQFEDSSTLNTVTTTEMTQKEVVQQKKNPPKIDDTSSESSDEEESDDEQSPTEDEEQPQTIYDKDKNIGVQRKMLEWEKKQKRQHKENMINNYELEKQGVSEFNESSRTGKGHRKMNTQYQLDDSQRSRGSGENANEFDDIMEKKNSQSLYQGEIDDYEMIKKQPENPIIDTDINENQTIANEPTIVVNHDED